MKKIYALAGAVLFCSAAVAQNGIAPYKADAAVQAGDKYSHQITDARTVIRDNTGERATAYWTEDFEGGYPTANNAGTQPATGTWTTTNDGANATLNWELTTVGHANDAGSTFTIPPLMSTSGDGVGSWMLLDSDSDGVPGTAEDNSLYSPTIDLTLVVNNALALEWQQFFAEWTNPTDDSLFLEVSIDGGTNWTQLPSIDDGVGRDNRPNPELVRMDLTSLNLAGENTVSFRWHWTGEWNYGWQIDDIQLVDLPPDNLSSTNVWATHANMSVNASNAGFTQEITYTDIPTSQIFDVRFKGGIQNLGANTQNNVYVTVDEIGGAFSGSSANTGLTIAPGEDTTATATADLTLTATPTQYDMAFDIVYDNVLLEDNPAGLLDTAHFSTNSDGRFSRDDNYYSGAGLWNGAGDPYVMGHTYQIQANEMMEGISVVTTATTVPGVIIYGNVYEIDATTGDFTLLNTSNDVEIFGYHIPAAAGTDPVKIWIPLQQSLEAGKEYVIGVGHYGGPDDFVIANSTAVNPAPYTTWLLDGTDNTWYYLTSTPNVRLHFQVPGWVGVEDQEELGFELFQNQPNPFNGLTQISYSLDHGAQVSLDVVDVTGKKVASFNEGTKGAGTYTVTLNSDELAAGIYNYTLTVDGQRVTKRMVVTK